MNLQLREIFENQIKMPQFIKASGLSEYAARQMILQGRVPFTRTGGTKGKYIIDFEHYNKWIRQEAIGNALALKGATPDNVVTIGQLRRVEI